MIPSRYPIFTLGPILATSWLLLALVNPDRVRLLVYPAIGNLIGTIFAHGTLAAAWSAFGPGPLAVRVPLSLLWVASLPVAVAINIGIQGGPNDAPLMLGVCVLAQWLIMQIPLWAMALLMGIRIHYRGDLPTATAATEMQFGIRQLLVLTAIVAAILGAGRLFVAWFGAQLTAGGESLAFLFLAAAAILMTLPLLLALLLPRLAAPATLAVLLLTALATAGERPLFAKIGGNGPDFWHFVWINAFQTFWVVIVIAALRLSGYGLTPRKLS